MIVVGGWPGRNVVGLNGRFGVRPAAFAVGGDFDSPFLNDVDSGDETTEFVGVVQSLPASGTVTFNDLGGFRHVGADDGSYSTVYRLFTWAQGGPITEHTPDATISTSFGSGSSATASGATLVSAASLVAGTAEGAASGTAAGSTFIAAASVVAGSAAGAGSATAAGVTLQAAASILSGGASGQVAGNAAGALITAAASLQAGAAEAGDAATAPGALMLAAGVLIPGAANAEASVTAGGALLTVSASLIPGGAYGPINRATPGYSVRPLNEARIATRRTLQ